MPWGLSDDVVARINHIFASFPSIEKALLYGSRAKGNYREGSDIDLSLVGDSLTPSLLAEIEQALDELLLPYRFDLSLFTDLDHVALREHIERVGVVFYERPNHAFDEISASVFRIMTNVEHNLVNAQNLLDHHLASSDSLDQKKLVTELRVLKSAVDNLRKNYLQKISALNELKSSLLKTYSGQIVSKSAHNHPHQG